MSSPNVIFSKIPDNIRKPGVYIEENVSNAIQGLQAKNDSIVVLAQMTTGSAIPEVPVKCFSDADAALYAGQGSIAHETVKALLYANPYADVTLMPLNDNGTTKATGSLSFTADAAAEGNHEFYVGSQGVSLAYSLGDTSTAMASALKTALSALVLPVSVTNTLGVLNLTAKNAGTPGNDIYLSCNSTIAHTLTQMSGGATDSTFGGYDTSTSPLGKIVGGGYSIVVNTIHQATQIGAVSDFVEFVSGPLEERPAIQVLGTHDKNLTAAAVKTLAGTTMNDGRASLAYLAYGSDFGPKANPWQIAGAYAGILASQSDPAMPYNGLELPGISAPEVHNRFSRTQQESFLNSGVTPLVVVPGEAVVVCRAISTYTTNSFGSPDRTLLDINTYRTLDAVRYQIMLRLQNRFQRCKISARTPKLVKSQVLDVLYQLEALELVKNVSYWKDGVICEVDSGDPTRLNLRIPADIVNGLSSICAVIQLILS